MSNVTNLKFKDEDEGGVETLECVQIDLVTNGYVVTYSYTDTEVVEVHTDKNAALDSIRRFI